MNKISKLLMVIALGVPLTALAESVSFETVSLKSGYVQGVGKIEISPAENGKLRVSHDKNNCSPDGRRCTRMAVFSEVVDAKVIEDRRPTDGDLLLGLTQEINLSVSSGYNIEGRIYYTAIVKSEDGSKTMNVALTPNVYVSLTK